MENTLIIITGLSASGKSTYANTLLNNNTKVVSSDDIRAELSHRQDQTQNEKVFRIFHKRIKEYLQQGFNVVADATNLTIKSRKQIIEIGKRANAKIESHIIVKDLQSCIEDDKNREFSVGEHVIQKQVRRFQLPFIEEGFDEIRFINNVGDNFKPFEYNGINYIDAQINFNQMNKFHNQTLDQHMITSSDYIYTKTKSEKLYIVMRLHDIGKVYTQTFDENNQAHYYGHENIGAYILLCEELGEQEYGIISMYEHPWFIGSYETVFYVNYHMLPNNWSSEKLHNKYKKLFGEEKYNNLLLMHNADKYRGE